MGLSLLRVLLEGQWTCVDCVRTCFDTAQGFKAPKTNNDKGRMRGSLHFVADDETVRYFDRDDDFWLVEGRRSRCSTPTSKCARRGPRFSTPTSKCARRGPGSPPQRASALVGDPGSPPQRASALVGDPGSPPQRASALVGDPGSPPQRASALVGDPGSLEAHISKSRYGAPGLCNLFRSQHNLSCVNKK